MSEREVIFEEVRAELGDPFDQNSEINVSLWTDSEQLRESLAALRALAHPQERADTTIRSNE